MSNPTFGLPSPTLPLTSRPSSGGAAGQGGAGSLAGPQGGGLIASIWYQFFVRMAQLSAERPIAPVTVGASPFVYTPSTIGNIFISGGTVSSIVLTRSGVTLTCPENIFIPVAANDTVTVTYSVKPTMTFVPSARA